MRQDSRGYTYIQVLATVGVILGIIALAWYTIVRPTLIRSKFAAQGQSAVASLRVINTAEISYMTAFHGYSPSLSALGTADTAKALGSNDPVIGADLASGSKSGYIFTYSRGRTEGKLVMSYSVNADPSESSAPSPHYYTDESGIIRQNNEKAAGPTDPQL